MAQANRYGDAHSLKWGGADQFKYGSGTPAPAPAAPAAPTLGKQVTSDSGCGGCLVPEEFWQETVVK